VWQVEAGSTYSCDMFHDDPFIEMKLKNKKIGFSLTNKEQKIAMHSLWPATFHYMQKNPHLIQPSENSIAPWLLDSKAEFNYCQMSSSFQVLDISFIRSDKFQQFFHYLDLVGGYFYERYVFFKKK
jgi:alpha 1,2-mannosyltransferase